MGDTYNISISSVPNSYSLSLSSIANNYEVNVTAGTQGPAGIDGEDGASAYEIAVANGYSGSESEWLESLAFDSSNYLPLSGGTLAGDLVVTGNIDASTYTSDNGDFAIFPSGAEFGSNTLINSSGNIALGGTLVSTGDISTSSNLTVTGDTTLEGDLAVDTNVLFVSSSLDRVGIGTDSPAAKLDVNGNINFTSGSFTGVGNENVTALTISQSPTSIGDGSSIDWYWNDTTTTTARIRTNAVGSSSDELEFWESAAGTFNKTLTLNGITSVLDSSFIISDDLTVLGDFTVDTDTLYVDSLNNRVGIGTTSPSYTLDVDGIINSTTSVNFGSILRDAGASRIYWSLNNKGLNQGRNLMYSWGPGTTTAHYQRDTALSRYDAGVVAVGDASDYGDYSGTLIADSIGLGTTTPSAKLDVNGDALISDDLTVLGDVNTMPNQTLDGGDASVLTKELMLRSEITESFEIAPFYLNGESPSSASMSQGNYNSAGSLNFTRSSLSGYACYLMVASRFLNYANGSGAANRFADPWTMFFEYDTNNAGATGAEFHVSFGWTSGLVAPTATDKCIDVVYNPKTDELTANVFDGTGVAQTSGPIVIGSVSGMHNYLARKEKFCIVWDGTKLSVYVARWVNYNYGSGPFTFTLIASVETSSLPTSMNHYNCYFYIILTEDCSMSNFSTFFQAPRFIRKAIYPIN